MFNSDFYPTPKEVYDMMAVDCEGKVVLEPHAGSGNLVGFLKNDGAKSILICENDPKLSKISRGMGIFIKDDFLNVTSDEISHVNMIVMNPPFSNAERHICHAFEIAPEGCEVISLCNYETISKDRRYSKLNSLVSNYGLTSNLGQCFKYAERTTNVEVGLVKLYKPIVSSEFNFDGFFMDEDEQEPSSDGIMKFSEVRALVNRYVGAMKCFDLLYEQQQVLSYTLKPLGFSDVYITLGYGDNPINSKSDFSRIVQKKSWSYIFNKMNMQKYVTRGVMNDINKFVETQSNIPFTMKNIYKMFEIIIGTSGHNMRRALEEAVDYFTKHTSENRWGFEGWKTNSGHMLNRKFIINGISEISWGGKLIIREYYSQFERLSDLVKVICNITGTDYNSIPSIRLSPCKRNEFGKYLSADGSWVDSSGYSKIVDYDNFVPNVWYKWAFFEFKIFKKGTMHLRFLDENVWYKLNQSYAKIKGFTLPEK